MDDPKNETIVDDAPDRVALFQAPQREWRGVPLHPLSIAREVYFQRLRKEHGEDDNSTVANTVILLWLLTHTAEEITRAAVDTRAMLAAIWTWSESNVPQGSVVQALDVTSAIIAEAFGSVVEEQAEGGSVEKKTSGQ